MIQKELALERTLSSLGSVVIAYSGGVDSAYLACIAHRALGSRACAITADSPSYPQRHRMLAVQIAEQFGFRHEFIRTDELDRQEYRANPANRFTTASTSSTLISPASPPIDMRSSSTATTPMTAATTGRAGRRRASSASAARSTTSISRRTRSASCRAAPGSRPGTSRRPRACRRGSPTTTK